MIENEASCPLQKAPLPLVMRQIQQARHLESKPFDHGVDDLPTALAPAGLGLHRIENNRSVLVETHPVVGKHRIGFDRLGGILHRAYSDALALQGPHESIELHAGRRARILAVRRLLHFVGQRGFRVVTERSRPNHQDSTGTLLS